MQATIKCPCCDEILAINIKKNIIEVSQKNADEVSDVEISETLKKLNIEFG